MEGLRRAYGIAEPVRRGMEMKIVKNGSFRPAALGGGSHGNLHEEVLAIGGRETEVGWEDVFAGMLAPPSPFPFLCLRCDWLTGF
jgi:proteasome maturation protein